ncbi:MAG: T9SS type A sorting domain-containing protein [Flavobacteriales bacterium]|nr:T9SS type A sorting domain-containing protein [Flavobacteriales bacterium]MCB0813952.1 T9SS type A sorting domain-containing protein [Flavobacteriales bacterium]
MKHITLLAATLLIGLSAGAQTLEATSFENWTGNLPDGWVGSKTSLETDSIEQVTAGVQFGTSAVRLINEETGHKRFSSQGLQVDSGETYTVQFYARGTGSIRTGLFDGRSASSGFSTYNPYITVTNTWTMYAQQLVCTHDSSGGEFILSVQLTEAPDHVEVDSVRIYVGAGNPATEATIYEIQYTTNPGGDSPLLGEQVSTGGIVTATHGSGYWIQNGNGAWSGVYVFDNNNSPAVGDSITLTAIVEEYFNNTELSSVTVFSNVSSGNPVLVAGISTADANLEDWEGQLVQVTSATCVNDDVINNNGQWQVDDGSGFIWIDDLIYAFVPTLNTFYDVTGVTTYAFSQRKIEPRDMNDISISSSVAERFGDVVNVYPNPTSDVLFVAFAQGPERAEYTLTDLTGRTVLGGILTSDRQAIALDGLTNGNYVLTLRTAQRLLSGRVQVVR